MSNEPLDTKTANNLAAGNAGTLSLGGELYLISQPTKADFLTLKKELTRQWKDLRKGITESFLKQIKADVAELPPDLQRIAIESACKVNATPRSPTDNELFEELLLEKDGVAFWLWVLVRKLQPNVTLAAIKPHITDENVDEIIEQILDANGLKEADPNAIGGNGSISS